jgi:hypothetical protein
MRRISWLAERSVSRQGGPYSMQFIMENLVKLSDFKPWRRLGGVEINLNSLLTS